MIGQTVDMKPVEELRVFVPALNYSVAKQFYLDLGFSVVWEGDELACFEVGEFRYGQECRRLVEAYSGHQARRLIRHNEIVKQGTGYLYSYEAKSLYIGKNSLR